MAPGDTLQMTSAGEGAMDLVSTNSHPLPPLSPHFGQNWYPLDFLPNYPARKRFITSAYEAGRHCAYDLYFCRFFTQMPKGTLELEGWIKQKYSLNFKLARPRLCFGTTVQQESRSGI